ncbi:MAG: polysaccharide deacetylase family protein [Clostridia bacterium]|nr:polysaccharide deacetylase family protein [Clostridia bacterium]
MKKTIILLTCTLLFLTGCTGRMTLEEYDANAPATVEDTGRKTTSPYTGFDLLPQREFDVPDPENARNIPTKKIEHSYGIARNGVVHDISAQAQKFFETKSYKALCYDTSGKKVLYLTFDCGWENGYTEKVLDILDEKDVPAAFFCTLDHIEAEPELIGRMINNGHIVGNHSAKHKNFAEISRKDMANEILTCDNYLRKNFGYTSPFFRFPEGAYNENALDLVQSMGYTSVFWSCSYADWDVENTKGAEYAFETVTSRLHPGAVILLHSVSPDNAAALGDIIEFARANGYEFRSLNDYGA